jgi:hypothetical protein
MADGRTERVAQPARAAAKRRTTASLTVERVNPKSEIRNPKQIRMTKTQMLKTGKESQSGGFERSDFEFVSDFVLRISGFLRMSASCLL